MNFNRKENKEVSTISFEIRIQTRFHKKSIEVVKTIGLILFTAGKHEESNRREAETDKGIYYLCGKFCDSIKEFELNTDRNILDDSY